MACILKKNKNQKIKKVNSITQKSWQNNFDKMAGLTKFLTSSFLDLDVAKFGSFYTIIFAGVCLYDNKS